MRWPSRSTSRRRTGKYFSRPGVLPWRASKESRAREMAKIGFLTSWATPITSAPICAMVSSRRRVSRSSRTRVVSLATTITRAAPAPSGSA